MADVTLVLRAENSQYIQKIKEAQNASQKLYDTVDKGQTTTLGRIEREIKMQEQLRDRRNKAYDIGNIERYNRLLDASKKRLTELEQAGLGVQKQSESLITTFGKWATGVVSLTMLFDALKKSFLDTTAGMKLMTAAGELWTQMAYNMVTANNSLNTSLASSIGIAKQINDLRVKERKDIVEIAKLQTEYNKLYFEASDRRKTDTERVNALNSAMDIHNQRIDLELENLYEQKSIVIQQLANREKSNKLLDQEAKLNVAIYEAEGRRYSETKRLESTKTALEEQITADWIAQWEERYKVAEDLNTKRADKEKARIKADYDNYLDYFNWYKDQITQIIKAEEKAKEDSWQFQLEISKHIIEEDKEIAEKLWDAIQNPKKAKQTSIWTLLGIDPESDEGQKKVESIKEMADTLMGIIDDIYAKRAEDAQRERELLDTRISEVQDAIDTETQLKIAGYASNVAAKKQELETLKKQRQQALLEEEAAIKKQRQFESISQTISLTTSVANILKSFTKLGPVGLLLSSVAIGALFTLFNQSKTKAAESSKFASGGWTGNGFYRDETGERVAGTVHEREFVIRRGPAHKFREVLEAINRDDRKMIFNKFNKLSPDLGGTTVNNVVVENNGPNKRLDQINRELRQLNKKQVKEEVLNTGGSLIIRKGDAMRIIKR